MPTLNIGNQSVQVDDSFLSLPPDQQNATVDEIAQSLGPSQGQQASGGVAAPTTPQANNADASSVGDIAKSAGIGAAEGAIGLAGLPATLADLGTRAYDYMTGSNSNASVAPFVQKFGPQALQQDVESVTGPFYQPKSQLGRYAQTAGSFAPNLIGGPESFATKLLTRVAAPAAGSELGGQAAQWAGLPQSVGQVAGAAIGGGAPGVLGRAVSPLEIPASRAAAADTLAQSGVTGLTAAQISGSRSAKFMEDELGNALGAGGAANKAYEDVQQQFTQAAMQRAGVQGEVYDADTADAAHAANSNAFDSVLSLNPAVPVDQGNLFQSIDGAATDYHNATGSAPTPFFDAVKNRLGAVISNNTIPGQAAQAIRSDIGALARRTTDPELRFAYYDMQASIDKALDTGLQQSGNGADAAAIRAARTQYKNLMVLDRAVSGNTEAASAGIITPNNLANADKAINSKGNSNFVRGNTPFADLARAGNQLMKAAPNSGTAQRSAAHLLPALFGSAIGGSVLGPAHVLTGGLAPGLAGRAIMSRPFQGYLKNQKAAALRKAPTVRNAARAAIFGSQNQ